MIHRLDIATHHYFPFHFMALGVAFILVALLLSLMYPLLAIGLFIAGLLFTTTHYRLRVDTKLKRYKEYLWILGFKKGIVQPFQNIEYLYLNKLERKIEYGFTARVHASKTVYMGFLQLSHDESLFIGESAKKKRLLKKIQKIAAILKAEIRDLG